MLAKLLSAAIVGLEAGLVSVEVDIVKGQPYFALVGLPDAAVRESKDRVYAAVKNSGLHFPHNRFPTYYFRHMTPAPVTCRLQLSLSY